MPFSLHTHLMSLLSVGSDTFNTVWPYTSVSLMALLFGLMFYALFSASPERISGAGFILLASLVILCCRLPGFFYGESNPDESQWLASVVSLRADFTDYFYNFYIYDFGRALTIVPLLAASAFGLAIDFGLAKLTAVLCWIVVVIFYFLLIRDIFGQRIALVATSIVVAYLATFSAQDYIAYNSETPTLALLSLFFFVFQRSVVLQRSRALGFFAGVLIASVLFAKEQSAYIVFVCGTYSLIAYFSDRQYAKAMLFLAGGFLACLLFLSPFVVFGKMDELLYWIYLNGIYMNFAYGQTFLAKLHLLFVKNNPGYFLLPILVLVFLLFFRASRNALIGVIKNNTPISTMMALLYLTSLYTVLSQGYLSVHYTLFLVLPAAYLLAFSLVALSAEKSKTALAAYSLLLFLLLAVPGLDKQISMYERKSAAGKLDLQQSELAGVILRYARPGDGMLVWGWDCKLFVETGLVRASRYWYTTFLRPMVPEKVKSTIVEHYERDIVAYRPRIIVEYLKGGLIVFSHIGDHPSINAIVEKNYQLVYQTDTERVYLLKEVRL